MTLFVLWIFRRKPTQSWISTSWALAASSRLNKSICVGREFFIVKKVRPVSVFGWFLNKQHRFHFNTTHHSFLLFHLHMYFHSYVMNKYMRKLPKNMRQINSKIMFTLSICVRNALSHKWKFCCCTFIYL